MSEPREWEHRWISPALDGTGDQVARWAAETLATAGLTADVLHVATSDAGAREALAFWRAAQVTGFAFAAPGAFPWTLANSPTGAISQALQITGGATTYVGGDEAVAAAHETARDDVASGLASQALVVSLSGDRAVTAEGGPVRVELAACVLGLLVPGEPQRPQPLPGRERGADDQHDQQGYADSR